MRNFYLLTVLALFTVSSCQKESPVVTTISIPNQIEIVVGDSRKISVSHTPANLPAPIYSWISSDPSIVKVDNLGNLSALKVGEATITVESTKLNLSATSKVKVNPVEAQFLILNPTSLEMILGDTKQLEALIQPDNTTNKTVVWQSSDIKIATISNTGIVTAVGIGKTSIIATTGTLSTKCEVIVNPVKVEEIQLNTQSLNIFIGSSIQITATIFPENATDKKIRWSSENIDIATVSEDGVVTGIGVGRTKIIATSGAVNSSCDIIINPIEISAISLNNNALSIEKGNSYQLVATIIPENATNKKLIWESSNINIVSVNERGKVFGLQVGSATVRASSQDKNISAECEITVKEVSVKGVNLDFSYLKFAKGETGKLVASIIPQNAANKSVEWSSSNPSIASIDQNGNILALNNGTATITVTTEDGNFKTSCEVNVLPIEILMKIVAFGRTITQTKTGFNITLHSKLTNPTSIPIRILSVIFIDPNRRIIEIQPGGSILKNYGAEYNVFSLFLNEPTMNDETIRYLSLYKVIYQFNAEGKDYHVEQYFDARSWTSNIN